MQTSAEIQTQIDQVEREVKDIHNGLKRTTRVQDLLDAHQELTNRSDVIKLLQGRLQEAQERETAAAERARRQANDDAQAEARAAYEDVTDRLNTRRLALIRTMTAEMDELDPLSFELQRLRREFSDAWLRNNPDRIRDFANYPKFPEYPLDLTEPEKHADDALNVLYASRNRLPGNYTEMSDALRNQGYQQFRAGWHNAPRPQQLSEPNTALDDAMAYAETKLSNGDD